MQNEFIAFIAIVAVGIFIAIVVIRKRSQQRSLQLREHFGPEYDHVLEKHGDRARAEQELRSREKRREELDIHLLSPAQCERFGAAWATVQQRFVDDPSGAVVEADGLVKEVMKARGYPMGDFEQRLADLSVEHANVLDHYRAARGLAKSNADGQASTEDLRQAMVHFRALFTDLLRAEARTAPPPLRESLA